MLPFYMDSSGGDLVAALFVTLLLIPLVAVSMRIIFGPLGAYLIHPTPPSCQFFQSIDSQRIRCAFLRRLSSVLQDLQGVVLLGPVAVHAVECRQRPHIRLDVRQTPSRQPHSRVAFSQPSFTPFPSYSGHISANSGPKYAAAPRKPMGIGPPRCRKRVWR
jgi:hypothetical protein